VIARTPVTKKKGAKKEGGEGGRRGREVASWLSRDGSPLVIKTFERSIKC